ncbi:MAG: SDR family oxidoreductase [Kiritimatiellia bacterium]|nr:SDR family oxidoreductase [Kiritimatiellia bacterium]
MEQKLTDRVALITGGGSGMGLATTGMLLESGARVAVLEFSAERADALRARHAGQPLVVVTGDVRKEEDVHTVFEKCRAEFGPVEILINNAGLGIPSPDLSTASIEDYDTMMDVNVKGVMLCTREALRDMKPKHRGHILTLISMAGQRSNPGAPLYCASKFAVRGFNSGLGDQVLKEGIKVTDINPGPVDTNYWGDRQVPREKFLSAADVADTIRFVLTRPDYMVIREINFDNIHWLAK